MNNQLYNPKQLIDMKITRRIEVLKLYANARDTLFEYLERQPEEQDAALLITAANAVAARLEQLRVIDESIETLELFIVHTD